MATCKTCGGGLHSDLSRTFGQCGACRDAAESIEAERAAAGQEKRERAEREKPTTPRGAGPRTV